jgi:hypothetical protein
MRVLSAPYRAIISSGETMLPRLLDIFAPPLMIMPWVNKRSTGSSFFTNPISRMNFVQKRE